MKYDFAEAVWNHFRTEGIDLKDIPSIEEQRAFVRDVASRGDEADVEAAGAENDWDFKRMVSADELVAFGIREKQGEIQPICKDGVESVPTLVLEVIDLFREAVETESAKT